VELKLRFIPLTLLLADGLSLKTIRLRTVLASLEIEREKAQALAEKLMVVHHTRHVENMILSVECFCMSGSEELTAGLEGTRQTRLEERLRLVDELFRRGMRARGFDPDQDENLALTAPLARLYAEREQLREELESLPEE
jgi:hypothetical protein